MHILEQKLDTTIGYLSGLERSSSSLQHALENSGEAPDFSLSRQQAERQQSCGEASTSEVGGRDSNSTTSLYEDAERQKRLIIFKTMKHVLDRRTRPSSSHTTKTKC